MSLDAPQWPDAEQVLLDLLELLAPTCTATEEEIRPPVIRVRRVGGGVDRLGLTDRARLEVATFGTTRAASRALTEQARQLVLSCGASSVNGVFIDRATEDTAPIQVPYEAPDLRRITATYVLSLRQQHFSV